MTWIWLGIVIFLIFIEVITVGLTTVWFVISGFVSLILSLFIDSVEIQLEKKATSSRDIIIFNYKL